MPVKEDLPKQKYKRGSKVRIADDLSKDGMGHFTSGCNAIVEYTYAQKYRGSNFKSYSLILLDENDKPFNSSAWYLEHQLTLIDENIEKGKDIIFKYGFED
ncbi:MAG: hypothetical protein V3V00_15760 [Saprospiraceae bacterium]